MCNPKYQREPALLFHTEARIKEAPLSEQPAHPLTRSFIFILISLLMHSAVLIAIWFGHRPTTSDVESPSFNVTLSLRETKPKPEIRMPKMEKPKKVAPSPQSKLQHDVEKQELPATPHNWDQVAEEYIQLEVRREAQAQRLKREHWRKAPSILWGPAPDFFAELPALSQYPTSFTGEGAFVLTIKPKKFSGFGIPLGDSCFLGILALDDEDYQKMVKSGRYLSPLTILNCDY